MTPDERIAATWQLLGSYADWMPGTRTSTGAIVHRSSLPGEAASASEDCRTCNGTGLVRRSGKDVACRACKGRGAHTVDAYTRREVTPERAVEDIPYEQLIRFRRVRCDGCGGSGRVTASSAKDAGLRDILELSGDARPWWRQAERDRCPGCRGSGSVEIVDERSTDASLRRIASDEAARAGLAVSADWLDSALESRRVQWSRGSYAELASALRRLETRTPHLHAALMRHVVYEPGEYVVSDRLRARLELAVEWLADQLPDRIRVSSDVKAAESRKRVLWRHRSQAASHGRMLRNGEIAALVLDHGQSAERVGELHGLTPKRVRQIVASAVTVQPAVEEPAVSRVRYGAVQPRLIASDLGVIPGKAGEWDRFAGAEEFLPDEGDDPPVASARFAL